MKKFLRILMLATVLTVALMIAFLCEAKTINLYHGRIAKVYDGDTIIVHDINDEKHRVRFYGIDAPEIKQEGGQESLEHLLMLLENIAVVRIDVQNIDLYGREVAIVYTENLNLNRRQIEDGYAWHYKQYDSLFKEEFAALEQQAREKKLGIWRNTNLMAPWEFRRLKRDKSLKLRA